MRQKIMCIYMLYNKINGKRYIGSTSDLFKRIVRHFRELNKNCHHSIYLQRAWNKYLPESFDYCVLEFIFCKDDLLPQEEKWINFICPEYNIGSIGGGDNISNHPDREKILDRNIKTLRNWWKKMTADQKEEYIKQKCFGENNPNWKGGISNPVCPSCGNNMSPLATLCRNCAFDGEKNPFYGKKHNEKTKRILSQKRMGVKPSNSVRVKINNIIYNSLNDAANALGVSRETISYRIKKKWTGYEKLI